ncbi:uncharacterized protein LOC144658639 isoform X2 [Oculina patagonica]
MPPRRDFRAKKKVTVSIVKEVKQEKGQCLDDVASIADENFVDDETWSDLQEDSTKRKRKFRRVRLRSIKAQGLPRQKGKTCCFLALCQARTCFSPFWKDASRRCLWPWAVYVKNTETVHAGGSLHHPDGRYRPYTFNDCVWWTSHNADHGYICEITAIGVTGKEKIVNTVNYLVTCSYIVTS